MIRNRRPTPPDSALTPDAAAGAFADAVLRRAVLTRRRHAPESSIDELVTLLPGYRDAGTAKQVAKDTGDDLSAARTLLATAAEGDGALGVMCRAAELTIGDTEVLAVLIAIDIDPQRRRLAGVLSDRNGQRHPSAGRRTVRRRPPRRAHRRHHVGRRRTGGHRHHRPTHRPPDARGPRRRAGRART